MNEQLRTSEQEVEAEIRALSEKIEEKRRMLEAGRAAALAESGAEAVPAPNEALLRKEAAYEAISDVRKEIADEQGVHFERPVFTPTDNDAVDIKLQSLVDATFKEGLRATLKKILVEEPAIIDDYHKILVSPDVQAELVRRNMI